ncbi:polyamine transporter 3 [Sodiomyces alkalinus F11]|uniref:Polyamine transporter 3 n=1 Tax=Sodiomyces alkalinus (strain CBS 110278 / VKM F-3762 / F11) TaxID=1314773 RepID=A0A3N2PMK3_SODAK|nr:polyamine transporter 3 [Sodiomyces alkalinus F11]ROT35755.1 polyamine transporter 3 [Sodiomyces alkalinus F11]
MVASISDPEKGTDVADGSSSSTSIHGEIKNGTGPERPPDRLDFSDPAHHLVVDADVQEPTDLDLDLDVQIEAVKTQSVSVSVAGVGAGAGGATLAQTRTGASTASRPPDFEVAFAPDDPENPRNWPLWYRCWSLGVLSIATWIVVLYSTSYTASIPGIMEEFGTSMSYTTLGLTTYLIGLATGCLVVAPLSELFGRRKVYLVCTSVFMVMIVPSGLSSSIQGIFVARFIGAVFGASLISNCPGSVFDLTDDHNRAFYMSMWSMAPMNGPATGPIIGGFVFQYLGWRWCNWIVLIMTGIILLAMFTVKETYAPNILRAKVARLRKETDDPRWWCRYDNRVSTMQVFKTSLGRPFVLAATEPILWAFNIWVSTLYSILYLCFVAYPIVFSQNRGWGPGMSGLAFTGIGIGTFLAVACEPLVRRIINAHPRDPKTGRIPPEAAARALALGAVLTPIGQLVFAWTCLPTSIHWAIPIAFGIPFGAGNTLVFVYSSNYLAGAYGIYSASALAGNAVIRSLAGGLLPLAGPSMYAAMTPQWAGTFLGLLEVALVPVPFVFWRYGDRIRAKSRVIRHLREDHEKNESRRVRAEARAAEKAGEARIEEEGKRE